MEKEQVKQEFIELYHQKIKRDGAEELLQWMMKSDFFEAPASTRFHGSYPGGLAEHSLNVYRELVKLVERGDEFGAENTGTYSEETIAIVALLHDLCKAQFYTMEYKNKKNYDVEAVARMKEEFPREVKKDSQGEFFWDKVPQYTIDELFPIGHGEKSVILVQGFMKLTAEEIMAIRCHMGGWDTSVKGGDRFIGKVYEKSELALLTHIADMMASYLLERE